MKQEELELMVANLCGMIQHKVYIRMEDQDMRIIDVNCSRDSVVFTVLGEDKTYIGVSPDRIRPYLRPMSSMTPEEKEEYRNTFETYEGENGLKLTYPSIKSYDYLNKKHLDSRGLIDVGLAIVAPDWMYK
jgi:hypothetical protein